VWTGARISAAPVVRCLVGLVVMLNVTMLCVDLRVLMAACCSVAAAARRSLFLFWFFAFNFVLKEKKKKKKKKKKKREKKNFFFFFKENVFGVGETVGWPCRHANGVERGTAAIHSGRYDRYLICVLFVMVLTNS
jgi:hypothetical protein